MNTDLKDVLGQIAWANGTAKKCKPFTPTEEEAEAAWAKLRNTRNLHWGCKLSIVFKEDAEWAAEEGDGTLEVPADTGYLIALPGSDCDHPEETGVVWCPQTRGDMDSGGPIWMHLLVLLANPQVARVEVVE